MIKIILAQPRGFCAGVIRAIEIVDQALDRVGAPVYVRHEIVHNRHVVDTLKAKGAVFVEELSEVPPGEVTVFSAHGVARTVQKEAEERGLPVVDATCPLVNKVHAQGRRYLSHGRTLILIGHAGHPEIEGTLGQIDGPVHLVGSAEQVDSLDIPSDTPVAFITQTTLSVDDTRSVIAALRKKFTDVIGPDTSDICYATQNRQAAVRDLCKQSDLILVVGSPNSSNSNRLREIGLEEGLPSYLIADGSEIDPVWFEGINTVGLTAGASAPEELVQSVITAIRALGSVTVEQLDGVEEKIAFRLPPTLRHLKARNAAHNNLDNKTAASEEADSLSNDTEQEA
ncbi:4-hydroxy-3-methylbut-2-enyl diphosphate reductase [Zymomonas sp.]|uniref:4-hydroxy-3-methylbut-2-enyl diphosphate reductase n=1 Tax=Zymomonas TaxID=541 RepID=UPI0025EA6175|nr:4-hydroxy-3-methylbut-2-enyl diphosphate reductase [Zymomonas sp.]MCA1955950.1 4-hydroxy-3-methylbut-2-enyl diphosphate reductase [Zymomonas sp.]